jgi:hypothetical protein
MNFTTFLLPNSTLTNVRVNDDNSWIFYIESVLILLSIDCSSFNTSEIGLVRLFLEPNRPELTRVKTSNKLTIASYCQF